MCSRKCARPSRPAGLEKWPTPTLMEATHLSVLSFPSAFVSAHSVVRWLLFIRLRCRWTVSYSRIGVWRYAILQQLCDVSFGCYCSYFPVTSFTVCLSISLDSGSRHGKFFTGQLFCSSCHTNETAVLPARVLHHWDFTHYHVSQLAKSYLDYIHEHHMICDTTVNLFLSSKVPALLRVMNVRNEIGTMLPFVRGVGN
ncbi:hypothetical protein KIW84_023245 [Lathyrus oleraceus]|uniref:Rubicon Homology domain-containing protein n=1 Tax=Pisum sativum TaxID=3888 RepID=A0A9D4YGC4_PEA|nr:hypothetical protein KIW84_023245 [Pisum sativum]